MFNHIDGPYVDSRPLASVALHEMEDITKTSSLYEVIEYYFSKDIMKNTGLSLDKFLDLPREIVNRIIELTNKKAIADNAVVDNLKNTMK